MLTIFEYGVFSFLVGMLIGVILGGWHVGKLYDEGVIIPKCQRKK